MVVAPFAILPCRCDALKPHVFLNCGKHGAPSTPDIAFYALLDSTPRAEVYNGVSSNHELGSAADVAKGGAPGYSYDNANRLRGITKGSASVSFAYDAANRRGTLTLPNGTVVSYMMVTTTI